MRIKVNVVRLVSLGACLLTLAAACSSSHSNTSSTTVPASSTTINPESTPNSIPYPVGEKIGLDNGWQVTVTAVHQKYAPPGLPPADPGLQYVAIDLTMTNQTSAAHTVNADKLFTMVDSLHKEHFVLPVPATPNGIDGAYPPGTTHSGRIVFTVPTGAELGLVLYGPYIGTQVSDFAIVPPTPPPATDVGPTETTTPATSGSVAGKATASIAMTSLGKVLVDGRGMTLYTSSGDTKPGTSICTGSCALLWPPLTVTGTPTYGAGLTASKFATITRTDGSTQLTYGGKPLYSYAGDISPGDTSGQGLGSFTVALAG